jgi:hypothetical protein
MSPPRLLLPVSWSNYASAVQRCVEGFGEDARCLRMLRREAQLSHARRGASCRIVLLAEAFGAPVHRRCRGDCSSLFHGRPTRTCPKQRHRKDAQALDVCHIERRVVARSHQMPPASTFTGPRGFTGMEGSAGVHNVGKGIEQLTERRSECRTTRGHMWHAFARCCQTAATELSDKAID